MGDEIGAGRDGRTMVAPEDNVRTDRTGRGDAAAYLRDLADYLGRASVAPGELAALVFEANGLDVDIRTRRKAHASPQPALRDMLGGLGSNCSTAGIAVSQLRRITFADRHVTVEFTGSDGRLQTRDYSIDAVIRAAIPSAASAATPKVGTASR